MLWTFYNQQLKNKKLLKLMRFFTIIPVSHTQDECIKENVLLRILVPQKRSWFKAKEQKYVVHRVLSVIRE
jgi:hypothetical protein